MSYTSADLLFRWKVMESRKHERRPGEVYVTDLILCSYKLVMEQKFPEVSEADPFNPVTLEGDLIHRGVLSVLKEIYGDRLEVEVEGSKTVAGITVKGRIDAILDKKHGIEIKSTKGDYGYPHPHHELQCRIYRWMFNLDSIELLYVSRDRITSIPVNGTITDDDIAKLITTTRYADEPWICDLCNFKFACSRKLTGKQRGGEVWT